MQEKKNITRVGLIAILRQVFREIYELLIFFVKIYWTHLRVVRVPAGATATWGPDTGFSTAKNVT